MDLAIESESAFVVIAGDLFDGEWHNCNTGPVLRVADEALATGVEWNSRSKGRLFGVLPMIVRPPQSEAEPREQF